MTGALYLLDTNMFSYIAKGTSPAARREWLRLAGHRDGGICLSVITEAEIRFGMAKHALSRQRADAIEGLLANLRILPWQSAEAAAYASLRASLEKQGVTVSAMDLLIAAQALAAGATLVTHDRLFHQLPGLPTPIDWATDL